MTELRNTAASISFDDTIAQLGANNAEAALLNLNQKIEDLDPDKRIAAIAPSELPDPLPAGDRGEYFLFNAPGSIDFRASTIAVNKGDRLWCISDGIKEDDESGWEILALPESKSPYYAEPILGVFDSNFPAQEGDRYIDSTNPNQIQIVDGVAEDFADGATVEIISDSISPSRSVKNNNGVLEIRDYFKRKKIIPEGETIRFFIRENGDGTDGLSAATAFNTWDELIIHLLNNYIIDTDLCFIQAEFQKTYSLVSEGAIVNIEGRGKITIEGNQAVLTNSGNAYSLSQGNEGVAWEITSLNFNSTFIFSDFKKITFRNSTLPRQIDRCQNLTITNCEKTNQEFEIKNSSCSFSGNNNITRLNIENSIVNLIANSNITTTVVKAHQFKNCQIYLPETFSFNGNDLVDYINEETRIAEFQDCIFYKGSPTNSTNIDLSSNCLGDFILFLRNCINRTLTDFSDFSDPNILSCDDRCINRADNDFNDAVAGLGVKTKQKAIEKLATRDRTYLSTPVSWLPGILLTFPHGWSNFDPATERVEADIWAICTQPQLGYDVGDRVLLQRRTTLLVKAGDTNNLYYKLTANRPVIARQDGNQNEGQIAADSWDIYIYGSSKRVD